MNTPTDDAQEGDMAEADGPRMLVGGARAETAGPTDEVRQHRGVGRRVTLGRQRSGGYQIWMGRRHVQSFCGEWEDITRFQLPEGIEQQVRINIEVLGEARMLRPEYSGDDDARIDVEHPDDGVELRLSEHPNNPRMLQDDRELISMFNALPPNNQEIIARQIRENYEEFSRPMGFGAEVARTRVTMEMFNELQRQVARLTALMNSR